jgi:hypothetical protein
MTEFVLVFALLTIESSYKADLERPVSVVPDTAQFWFGTPNPWRIRTFAMDHDIHIHSLGAATPERTYTPVQAEAHLRKQYADVLSKVYVLKFKDPSNINEVTAVLSKHKLPGLLEVAPAGFAFYNPDRARYKTQSAPK